ncbi:tRNA uridine-5-carboxymethylaminomethyl(34) synthesis GTPase MnmE [candidate division WOR-3 bacterium]|jgi:tRNA modification GTPase|nr:tRNA uridine-5-carboxymethylaminomethyl(34) synthesis GTPase MnmE [candidate division WOR-3 bacterium]
MNAGKVFLQANTETISAITTPIGIGAISGIRISGSKTRRIVLKIIKKRKRILANRIYHDFVIDGNCNVIDEIIFFFRKAPNTYTGFDEAEIFTHGGYAIPELVLNLIIENGARIAERGEFTQRAFINGKIDLLQAESVMDIVNAKTREAARNAINILQGKYSMEIKEIKDQLLYVLTIIDANIDFPEDEDIYFDSIKVLNRIGNIKEKLQNMIKEEECTRLMKRGVNVVIVGKPNTGKSSLFNTLMLEEKAIVTDVPGTTRDIIEGWINIEGIPVLLKDTAGIRITNDIVESVGIEKTKNEIKNSDIILALFDGSNKLNGDDKLLLSLIEKKNNLFYILTKNDIEKKIDISKLKRFDARIDTRDHTIPKHINKLILSYIKNNNIVINIPDRIIVRIKEALKSLSKSHSILYNKEGLELASFEIKNAIDKLSNITGEITSDDILNNIFSSFCIGK